MLTAMRTLSPYEKTHLARFEVSVDQLDFDQLGETPVEYITGKVEFCDNIFLVDERVLIPRIETEELVELVVNYCQKHFTSGTYIRCIDVGTGSGAIGISIWQRLTKLGYNCQIVLSDVSADAVSVAQSNCAQTNTPLLKQSDLTTSKPGCLPITSDLLQSIPKGMTFHVIIANLPYIPSSRIAVLQESVREYEPHVALDGGTEGLTLIAELIDQAPNHLESNGAVFLELDHSHRYKDLFKLKKNWDYQLQIFKDSFRQNRFAQLSRFEPLK